MVTEFLDWFSLEWQSNVFTLFTVVLSGIISWFISAIFFHKGNRINFEVSVIRPIREAVNSLNYREGYSLIEKAAKEYAMKYAKSKERRVIDEILAAYRDMKSYSPCNANIEILLSYFEYKLQGIGVTAKEVPIYIREEEEVIGYEYPDDWYDLKRNLYDTLKNYNEEDENQDFEEMIREIFETYSRGYCSQKEIRLFDDYSLKEVLKKSKIREEWDEKIEAVKKRKAQFLDMKIVKSIT